MNEENDKIDFSSLDPSVDETRWERRIRHIVHTACEEKARPVTIGSILAAWFRPALAAASVAAGLCVTFAAIRSTDNQTTSAETEPALALSEWAATDEVPDARRILTLLGGADDEK